MPFSVFIRVRSQNQQLSSFKAPRLVPSSSRDQEPDRLQALENHNVLNIAQHSFFRKLPSALIIMSSKKKGITLPGPSSCTDRSETCIVPLDLHIEMARMESSIAWYYTLRYQHPAQPPRKLSHHHSSTRITKSTSPRKHLLSAEPRRNA